MTLAALAAAVGISPADLETAEGAAIDAAAREPRVPAGETRAPERAAFWGKEPPHFAALCFSQHARTSFECADRQPLSLWRRSLASALGSARDQRPARESISGIPYGILIKRVVETSGRGEGDRELKRTRLISVALQHADRS